MQFTYARTYPISFVSTSNPPHFRSESAVSYMFSNANSDHYPIRFEFNKKT
jgi:hypothetical protein